MSEALLNEVLQPTALPAAAELEWLLRTLRARDNGAAVDHPLLV